MMSGSFNLGGGDVAGAFVARFDRKGHHLWSHRVAPVGSVVSDVVAAPHRDVLLLARGEAIEELHRRAEDAVQRAPHPVSGSIFAITPQGPRPLQG